MTFLDRVEPIDLVPYVRSLAIEQLSRRRDPWQVRDDAAGWEPTTTLDSAGIGLDSFDLITLAGTANRLLLLHEAAIEEYLLARRRFIDWAELAITAWRRAGTPTIGFLTSGTTGERTLVTHPLATLQVEIDSFLEIVPEAGRVVSYVPPHHIYGFLFSIMMPVAAATPAVHRLNPLARGFQAHDRIIAHPTLWQGMGADAAPGTPLTGVSSTGPLAPDVARRIRDRGVRLFEVYGSTETAGVGWRDEPGPYRLLPHWSRADAKRALRHADGTVVPLMDRLEWHGRDHFIPTGRVDRMVQVGGHNVSPDEVRRRLMTHPLVADASVRLMTPSEGERLKAFVVPSPSAPPAAEVRRVLEAWALETFGSAARPASITIGAELPKNRLGKPSDWSIARESDPAT